jgi:methionyl-tRNA formyltransferase
MRIVIITGSELRHRFFAKKMHISTKLLHVYFEKKANIHEKLDCTPIQREIIDFHFAQREKKEQDYFGKYNDVNNLPHSFIDTGKSNDALVCDHICRLQPDVILLFGSSLIRDPLMNLFPNRIINLHLGLSPYYRGSGTNFWPLYYKEPECVGATIHLATSQVDAGAILYQVRPDFYKDDNIHDLGNKTIIAAVQIAPKVISEYLSKRREPVNQILGIGRVCKRKDLTAEAIENVYKNFSHGMIEKLIDNFEERISMFPIII